MIAKVTKAGAPRTGLPEGALVEFDKWEFLENWEVFITFDVYEYLYEGGGYPDYSEYANGDYDPRERIGSRLIFIHPNDYDERLPDEKQVSLILVEEN